MQNDIDERKVKPGQYFILKFDFSKITKRQDLTQANETLTKFLNSSIQSFYRTYAAYLGESYADLCKDIDNMEPNISLQLCVESVRDAIQQGGRLAGIEGIYVLVDEYDAFSNHYLELQQTAGQAKIAWEGTTVGETFTSFWSAIKSLATDGFIQRVFITGISPLSLSSFGSSFNILSNVSFHKNLSGLCGLTHSDVDDTLEKICKSRSERDLVFSEMIEYLNGYHFCNSEKVKSVFNTEICLAYLQSLIQGNTPNPEDPENSEISERFLRALASSAPAIADFEKASKLDEYWEFTPLEYQGFK